MVNKIEFQYVLNITCAEFVYLSIIGKKGGRCMAALLLRAMSVCVNECWIRGFPIIRLARALFINAIDASGGEGDDVMETDDVRSDTGVDILSEHVSGVSLSFLFSQATRFCIIWLLGGFSLGTLLVILWSLLFVHFGSLSISSSSLFFRLELLELWSFSWMFCGSLQIVSLDSGLVLSKSTHMSFSSFTNWVSISSASPSVTSPTLSWLSASLSDLASSPGSTSSLEFGWRCVNRSLLRHFARRFWNQTWRKENHNFLLRVNGIFKLVNYVYLFKTMR